jgi:phosphoribosyl-AMP cyclohydrolase
LRWNEQGLLPAVVQDEANGAVLMVAWMNEESLRLTLQTGQTHFWSRSRRELWHKGATSGNVQDVVALYADCDGDTLLVRVRPAGPACHTGNVTCFYREFVGSPAESSE